MDKNEVIYRLKQHLKAREQENGELNKKDLYFCVNYVMDFLLISKRDAKKFLKEHIPFVLNL